MLGLIFNQLKNFVIATFSENVWENLLQECNIKRQAYHDTIVYSDKELICIVGQAVKVSGISLPELLENFGEFIGPSLIEKGKQWKLISENWKTFDIIKNLFSIHKGVLMFSVQASAPPDIHAVEISENELKVCYRSAKNLPELAIGVIKGVGKYYEETLEVEVLAREGMETTLKVIRK